MRCLRNRKGKYSKNNSRATLPLWSVIVIDILMVGIILVIFAFFHHVLPFIISEHERQQALASATEPPETEPIITTVSPVPVPEETVPETTEAPVDNRTEWQKKFAEHFSDEVILTENSYTSPEVSITIETITTGEGSKQITYHVADIYIASMENFTTHTANNEMRYFGTQDVLEMDAAANGILSISGDFLTYQKTGFLMRNGEIYTADKNTFSICVLYDDGVMETYEAKTYDIDEIIARGAVQVWSFGPVLLDEDGNVKGSYNVSTAVSYNNPRSAIGYYEPGHYCFVVVDGRQEGYSAGMTIPQLAAVFEELGCTCAYNLDGGGSAVMVFNHERYSRQSNGGDRELGDILVITEAGFGSGEQEEDGE